MLRTKAVKVLAALSAAAMIVSGTGMTSLTAYAAEFDPAYYASTYPDVAAAFGTDADLLLNHYLTCGQKEGRKPSATAQPGEAVTNTGKSSSKKAAAQPATTYKDFALGQVNTLRQGENKKLLAHHKELDAVASNLMNKYMVGADQNTLHDYAESLLYTTSKFQNCGGYCAVTYPAAAVKGFTLDQLAPVILSSVYTSDGETVLNDGQMTYFGCHFTYDAAGNLYCIFVATC